MTDRIDRTLADLGLELPQAAAPVARKGLAAGDGDAENVFLMDDDLGIGDKPVRLNLEVPISVRRDMKGWSSWHDRTMTSVILEGFDLMKQRYGA